VILLAQTLGHVVDVAAAVTPSPAPKPVNSDKVQPGLLGLGFFVALAVAVVFLFRSMRNRLANIDVDRHRREQEAQGTVALAEIPDNDRGPDSP
jgi:hypothetical protein